MMRGVVFLGNRRVAVKDFPDPEPGPNEALVRVKAATICGSDLHIFRRPEVGTISFRVTRRPASSSALVKLLKT